jgi:genome maintenance exonuclease 1
VHVSEVWGSEVALYEKGRSAGTTDAVGIYKDKASIIDFKNSRKVKKDDYVYDYLTQLAAYIKMHNCMFGTDIKNGAILLVVRGNDKGKDFGEFQSWELSGLAFQEHLDDWNRRVDLYYSKHNQ